MSPIVRMADETDLPAAGTTYCANYVRYRKTEHAKNAESRQVSPPSCSFQEERDRVLVRTHKEPTCIIGLFLEIRVEFALGEPNTPSGKKPDGFGIGNALLFKYS